MSHDPLRAVEHGVEHVFGEPPHEGVLLANRLFRRGWTALSAGTFSGRLPLTLMVAAAIMPMFTFGSVRADMAMHLDRLGQSSQAPGEEDVDGLTSLGTLLFVSLPMVALATMLGL